MSLEIFINMWRHIIFLLLTMHICLLSLPSAFFRRKKKNLCRVQTNFIYLFMPKVLEEKNAVEIQNCPHSSNSTSGGIYYLLRLFPVISRCESWFEAASYDIMCYPTPNGLNPLPLPPLLAASLVSAASMVQHISRLHHACKQGFLRFAFLIIFLCCNNQS